MRACILCSLSFFGVALDVFLFAVLPLEKENKKTFVQARKAKRTRNTTKDSSRSKNRALLIRNDFDTTFVAY